MKGMAGSEATQCLSVSIFVPAGGSPEPEQGREFHAENQRLEGTTLSTGVTGGLRSSVNLTNKKSFDSR